MYPSVREMPRTRRRRLGLSHERSGLIGPGTRLIEANAAALPVLSSLDQDRRPVPVDRAACVHVSRVCSSPVQEMGIFKSSWWGRAWQSV